MNLNLKEGMEVGNIKELEEQGTDEDKMLESPFIQSRSTTDSFDFNESHFYQFVNDHFSRINLRLDPVDER